jgi:hypothetical protein
VVVEGDNNSYINIIVPDARESGILFGTASNAASGGIVYNNIDPWPGNGNGMQFRTNGNVTRMVLTWQGNVGIGINTPVEKLEVDGAVKATTFKAANFQYTTPKTYYASVPGTAFRGLMYSDSVTYNSNTGGVTLYSVRNARMLMAPVQLPQGAIMKKITAHIVDYAAPMNARIYLNRKTLSNNIISDYLCSVTSSGNSGVPTAYSATVSEFSNNHIIDNSLYSYYFTIESTGTWGGNIMETIVVVIEYTVESF